MQVTVVTSLSEECHRCYEFITKKNDPYSSMGKNQKLCHNWPAIYLFSWKREGNPYISNPIKYFKKLNSVPSDVKPL